MTALRNELQALEKQGREIYPPKSIRFRALKYTPLDKVRVVIIGQDPYYNPGQANGLAFSVNRGVDIPPSLDNIMHEIADTYGLTEYRMNGDLTHWTEQGVLLLNSVLSVERGRPGSHVDMGWEDFTDEIVSVIDQDRCGVCFMLWGQYAQRKCDNIDEEKHLVLKAPHPSPRSAHRGFLGCGHFREANNYMRVMGLPEIDWRLER